MIMNEKDKVNFYRYKKEFERCREVCDCGSHFDVVILERSDRDALHVKCSNDKCTQHTVAFKIKENYLK